VASGSSETGATRSLIDLYPNLIDLCGLPADVDGLVLELDAAYSDSAIDSPDQADESQDLTYVDIDTFLANF